MGDDPVRKENRILLFCEELKRLLFTLAPYAETSSC
jgi:hypothetical protein